MIFRCLHNYICWLLVTRLSFWLIEKFRCIQLYGVSKMTALISHRWNRKKTKIPKSRSNLVTLCNVFDIEISLPQHKIYCLHVIGMFLRISTMIKLFLRFCTHFTNFPCFSYKWLTSAFIGHSLEKWLNLYQW